MSYVTMLNASQDKTENPTEILAVVRQQPDGAVALHGFKTGRVFGVYDRRLPINKGAILMAGAVAFLLLGVFAFMSWQVGRWHGRQEAAQR